MTGMEHKEQFGNMYNILSLDFGINYGVMLTLWRFTQLCAYNYVLLLYYNSIIKNKNNDI